MQNACCRGVVAAVAVVPKILKQNFLAQTRFQRLNENLIQVGLLRN